MARQILPIVGAAVGFVVTGGNPMGAQAGFAIGSIVGNAIDPIEMQGRKLGDAPTQVAAEGGARAIVFGKGCIRATCVIERGGRRVIKERQSQGKGSGPTTVNERALWTFAIGLGEAIVGGKVLRIWEAEKLVYDVTPDSAIPGDSAKFAGKFRFYDGSDDQLPDPALEALYGTGNAPYYRGTAYLVFPQYDLTDFGETVPPYRVEVASLVENFDLVDSVAFGDVISGAGGASLSSDGISWGSTSTVPALPYGVGLAGRIVAWGVSDAFYSDDGVTWTKSVSSLGGSGGERRGSTDGDVILIAGGGSIYRSTDRGETFSQVPGSPSSNAIAMHEGLAVSVSIFTTNSSSSTNQGDSWSSGNNHGLSLLNASIATDGELFIIGGAKDGVAAICAGYGTDAWAQRTLPGVTAATVRCIAYGGGRWILGTDNGETFYSEDGAIFTKGGDFGDTCRNVDFNGHLFIMVGGNYIKTSPDGVTWTQRSHPFGYATVNVVCEFIESPNPTAKLIPLAAVLKNLHDRCGHAAVDYDMSEVDDMIHGVTIEQTVTGSEAIISIIGTHWLDPSDYDGSIHYVRRGKPVVRALGGDDLVDEPEEAQRNNAIEYPRKVHLLGQRADLAYSAAKSTSARYSKDARVVGEASVASPETFDEGETPLKAAIKLHKVLWTKAEGETTIHVTDEHLDLVPTDCVDFSYAGHTSRYMIDQISDEPGVRKLKMTRDRQSAYEASPTDIPTPPPPTPPQPSTPTDTILAIIDGPALLDNADTLHYLAAATGDGDPWVGFTLQQSLDGGATFMSIDTGSLNAIMGELQAEVSAASPYYTDTTNRVIVKLYTDDELESRTQQAFLSNGGAFFLSWQDSGSTRWELMQFRDAAKVGDDWELSHLLRGRKNTETAGHPVGATFVYLDTAVLREAAQSAWIGTEMAHRAVSNGLSPETASVVQTQYAGYSQREWPVAELMLERAGDDITATVVPRHRFGTSMNPIRSINWIGYRWTVTDGANTITRDGTSASETFDATGWASPVSVTVSQINRITGAGDAVTEDIA